jgi:formylmethanofuran dehydrogenase subunit E
MPEKKHLKEYFDEGAKFHGHLSPGIVIGIFMVDMAKDILGPCELADVVVESSHCIPDAVQIMTPCTYGNGWMKVKNWDKIALTIYDKGKGDGVRVYLDIEKARKYPHVYKWYTKQGEVKTEEIVSELMEANTALLSWQKVRVRLPVKKNKPVSICPSCGEAFKVSNDDVFCMKCSGKDDYYEEVTDVYGIKEEMDVSSNLK